MAVFTAAPGQLKAALQAVESHGAYTFNIAVGVGVDFVKVADPEAGPTGGTQLPALPLNPVSITTAPSYSTTNLSGIEMASNVNVTIPRVAPRETSYKKYPGGLGAVPPLTTKVELQTTVGGGVLKIVGLTVGWTVFLVGGCRLGQQSQGSQQQLRDMPKLPTNKETK